jgi:uncharacterized membrane protein HdeD (DUF308 family)
MSTTSSVLGAERKSVTWSIVLSVLIILAGILAIVVPPVAGIAVTIFLGWLLIFGGVMHLVFAWQRRTTGALLWELLLGIVYILAGVYLLLNPVVGLVSLTFALAIYLFVAGIIEFILALRLRPAPGSGWLFVDGVVSVILAILIWRTWPSSSAWVLGMLVGFAMLFSGLTRLMLSLAARHLIPRSANAS